MTAEISTVTTMRQPKALYLLVCVQMWECFSFYGMRALLVLYMVSELKFTDFRALGIFAVYTGLVELGGLVGGMVADRMLGLRRAISLGGWLIAAGHVTMAFQSSEAFLFLGLALIIVGSSLFSTNISALLGMFYQHEDSRREEGFTLFYVGINLGALLASLVCGYVGEQYGWHYGFSLAAIGMVIGNIALSAFGRLLQGKGQPPVQVAGRKRKGVPILLGATALMAVGVANASLLLNLLPWISIACLAYVVRRLMRSGKFSISTLVTLCFYLGGLALFYAAEEQIGSSLMLFSDRHVTKSIFDVAIPATVLLSLNPMTILLIGPYINRILKRFGGDVPTTSNRGIPLRMVAAFLMAAAAFTGLSVACLLATGDAQLPLVGVMGSVIVISISELFVGPAVYSFCSEVAPEGEQGAVMGLVPLGFSLASFLGGHLSQLMAVPEGATDLSMRIYGEGFGVTAGLLIVMGVILAIGVPLVGALMRSKRDNRKEATA